MVLKDASVLSPEYVTLHGKGTLQMGFQALELVMGAGFQGGCHLITWALKQRIFSVTGRSGRCGGKEEVWTWVWRAVGGFEAGGGVMTQVNAGGLWPGGMGLLEASNETGTSALQLQRNEISDHKLLEQEWPTLPWSFWKGTQLWCYLQFNLRDPKTFLNCEIIHLCFKSLHLWQLIKQQKKTNYNAQVFSFLPNKLEIIS